MAEKLNNLHTFAKEAEEQYRRLADLAEEAGVNAAAEALREKASRMKAILQSGKPRASQIPDLSGVTPEVHVILTQLFTQLQVALAHWPPETPAALAELVNEVLSAADQLGKLRPSESRKVVRPRRRWNVAEPPPAVDPPTFPGPRGRARKKG